MDWHWLRALLNLPDAASSGAVAIDTLHFAVIGTSTLGAATILVTALYFVVRYRRRGEAGPTPVVRSSLALEVGNSLLLLALFLAFWSIGFLQYAAMQEPPPNALEVRVIGRQWLWSFAPDGAVETTGYLVVPSARPVRITLTSRDVIHSFYVPNLRLKRDAVPGRYTSLWFEARKAGVFPIYCAEFCGTSHSRMASDLVVLTPSDYRAYLDGRIPSLVASAIEAARARGIATPPPSTPAGQVARGLALARENACFTCHTLDGRSAIGPSWRGLYRSMQPLEGGGVARVDEAYIRRSILEPRAQVALGYRSVMPTYYAERLDGSDVDALVAFIRSQGVDGANERRGTR